MKLVKEDGDFVVTQSKFALEILSEFDFLDSKPVYEPLNPYIKNAAKCGTPLLWEN